MPLRIITPPPFSPISLIEAKAHLRVDHSDEDDIITSYVAAATDDAEKFTGRAFVDQIWELVLDEFPEDEIKIPLPPLLQVISVNYYDSEGLQQNVGVDDYFVDNVNQPGWVVPQGGAIWPTTLDAINSVWIRFRAGYQTTDSPADTFVPAAIRQAILLAVGDYYANRENQVVATIANRLPIGAEALLRRYRVEISMA